MCTTELLHEPAVPAPVDRPDAERLVLGEIPDGNPSKKVALDYVAAYEKLYGSKPATFGANVFDAGLLLQRAVPE